MLLELSMGLKLTVAVWLRHGVAWEERYASCDPRNTNYV